MSAAGETDLFAELGLPRRYEVAAEELEARFHERSRLLHPDRFARATPRERRLSLERTTRLNQAHRTLRDPWARAEHLLALLDPAAPAGATGPAFLEEQLAAREALAAARARHDAAAVAAAVRGARDALTALERELARHLADPSTPGALAAARSAIARARFHQALLAAGEAALDARVAR